MGPDRLRAAGHVPTARAGKWHASRYNRDTLMTAEPANYWPGRPCIRGPRPYTP